jgi:hypothetical protein
VCVSVVNPEIFRFLLIKNKSSMALQDAAHDCKEYIQNKR